MVAKDGAVETGYQSVRDFMVTASIKEIKHNSQEIKKIETAIKSLMAELDTSWRP